MVLVSLIPQPLAFLTISVIFGRMSGVMQWVIESLSAFNSSMLEYINGMRLIKATTWEADLSKSLARPREEHTIWNEVA